MDGVTANQVEEKQWYLAVGEQSLGPLPTNLVTRGIQSGKVPVTAWVCQVGDSGWSALSSFIEFQEALELANAGESAAGPVSMVARAGGAQEVAAPTGSETSHVGARGDTTVEGDNSSLHPSGISMQRVRLPYEADDGASPANASQSGLVSTDVFGAAGRFDAEPRQAQGSFSDVSGQREVDPELRREVARVYEQQREHGAELTSSVELPDGHSVHGHTSSEDDGLGIDITFDEHDPAVDWNVRFHSYFLVGSPVELPEEERLLKSLHAAPKSTFLHDEALWNLALCLAFGSEEVASATATTFFHSVCSAADHTVERLDWMCRTLLSKGFMPSGIPRVEGNRGIDVLRQHCPRELASLFERQISD
ncbi:MAG: hypothetical protein QM784_02985 [Polyangiaceae bacterium]